MWKGRKRAKIIQFRGRSRDLRIVCFAGSRVNGEFGDGGWL